MDVNTNPDFHESFVLIRGRYGADWAKRFVLAAPLMLDDDDSQVRRAFMDGLAALNRGDRPAADASWAMCQWLMRDLAAQLVVEAEDIAAAAH